MTDKQKKGWKLGMDSFSKMIVWFKDGNTRTFYSLDWASKYSKIRDQEIGMTRLKRLVAKYGARANTVEIYDLGTGGIIAKYFEGVEVDHREVEE